MNGKEVRAAIKATVDKWGKIDVVVNDAAMMTFSPHCLRKVRVLADKRGVSLNLDAPAEMPVRGDEQLLRRLLMNLLDNAIKYNHEGGRVSVRGETTIDFYRITISDTGAGIPEEQKSKIFERFYRADIARSRSQETLTSGAGLGLSIAQWVAEIHRGKIEPVSSDETGSAFAVVFPIEKSAD